MSHPFEKGFTLIEVVVYLGLFSLLFVGVLSTALSVTETGERTQARVVLGQEANFLRAKVNREIDLAASISVPATNATGSVLSVVTPAGTVSFDALGSEARLQRGSGTWSTLNASNVQVSNLAFQHTVVSGTPDSVLIAYTLTDSYGNREDYSEVRYLKK